MMHKESGKQMGSSDLGRGMGKGGVTTLGRWESTASSRVRVMGEEGVREQDAHGGPGLEQG